MKTSKQIESEFTEELMALLRKYGTSIDTCVYNEDDVRITVEIQTPSSKKSQKYDYTTIDFGDSIDPDMFV